MKPRYAALLCLMCLIGGFGFVFMRIGVGHMAPVWLIELRLLVAIPILLAVLRWQGLELAVARHWRLYLLFGIVNISFPWLISTWAIQTLYASLLGIINALSPLFGALIGLAWLRVRPTGAQLLGFGAGLAGVTLLMGVGGDVEASPRVLAVTAIALLAPVCFGAAAAVTSNLDREKGPQPLQLALGSMIAAALLVAPLLAFQPPPQTLSLEAVGVVVCLGVFNTATNFLVFYVLIRAVGPTPPMATNYVIPVLGLIFARLLLDEPLPQSLLSGGTLAILGTLLATGSHRPLLRYLAKRSPQRG